MNKELWKINESLKDVVAKLFGVKKGLIESDELTRKSISSVVKATKSLKKKNRDGEIIKAIKDIPKTKFPKVQKVEVKNPVSKVEVDKPSWYKVFKLDKDIFDPLLGLIGTLVNRVFRVRIQNIPKSPKEYLSVRLTDGKFFTGIPSGGGGGFKAVWLKNLLGNRVNPAIVENQIKDFLIEVAKGTVTGHSYIIKFGENPEVNKLTPEDVWDFGGLYTFSTSAIIDSLSSSDDGDTQDITVIGLDENWEQVSQVIALTGQTRKALDTNLIRVYRMFNSGTTDFAGGIYCYEDTELSAGVPVATTKIRAFVNNGNNQTLMTVYTVPAGKTGYIINEVIGLSKAKTTTADLSLRARPFGGVFQIKGKLVLMSTGTSTVTKPYRLPVMVPAKTDIVARVDSVSADDTAVSASWDILLVDD